MTALDALLDRVLADPLVGARVAGGGIGYVGTDIPLDLLEASGRVHCHLPWDADRATPRANQWLESSFPGWARSIVEDWATGRFDLFETVIFTRGDDSAQRLYYYVCELRRRGLLAGPEPLIFDIAKVERTTSADRTIAAVRDLALRFGIDDPALSRGIAAANRRRELFARIHAERRGSGALHERIARASLFADIDTALGEADLAGPEPEGRILLAGTAPPDDRLHRAIDATGWAVTRETHDRTLTRLGAAAASDGDPATAIGRHAHALRSGPRSFADRSAALIDAATRARADAVVLWLVEEDESAVWQLPSQMAALAAAKLPVLALTRRRWDASDGAADEIAAFIEGLA